MVALNVSRGRDTPIPGIVTRDEPSPLEAFWKGRHEHQHVIPADELTVRKGLGIFDQMEAVDETIAYSHRVKRQVRMATGCTVEEPKDDDGNPLPGSEAIADHIREQIEHYDEWDLFLWQMLDATKQGHKLAEIVTEQRRVDGKQAWAFCDLLVRNSRWFAYNVNEAGKPIEIKEYWGSQAPDSGGISTHWPESQVRRHPVEKFVRFSWQPSDSNAYSLYGRSDFRTVYRCYFLKDLLLKRWGETLDTYTHPIMVALSAPGLTEQQRQDLLNYIIAAAKKKGAVVPGEFFQQGGDFEKQLRIHEVTGKAGDFEQAVEYLDKAIMRGLFLGSLVADTGKHGGGSLALGKGHMDLFLKLMDWLGKSLGTAIRSTLFKQIVLWNFGEDALPLTPSLVFKAAGDSEAQARGTMVSELVNCGVLDAREPWLREYIGGLEDAPESIQELREQEIANEVIVGKDPVYPPGHPKAPTPEVMPGKSRGLAARGTRARIESVVDEGAIEARERARQAKYGRQLNADWREVFRGNGGFAAAVAVALRTDGPLVTEVDEGPMVSTTWRMYVEAMVDGAVDAFDEINRARSGALSAVVHLDGEGEAVLPTSEATLPLMTLAEFAAAQGVDLDERVREVAERVRLRQSDLTAFANRRMDEIQAEVRRQVDKARSRLAQDVEKWRGEGVKPKAALRGPFKDLESKWVGVESDLASETSAAFETAENSVYNEGRYRLYEATPKTVVMGYLYVSVRDRNTTSFCRQWDGYKCVRDDPIVRTIMPPNHWRCRARIVAILAGEMSVEALEAAGARKPSVRPEPEFAGMRWSPPVPGLR